MSHDLLVQVAYWLSRGSKTFKLNFLRKTLLCDGQPMWTKLWVYLGVKTCDLVLCFKAIVRVSIYYVDFIVFFVLRHW